MKLSVMKEVGNFLTNTPTILFSRSILFSEVELRTEVPLPKEIQNTTAYQ
jgi:hypothetical protein